MQLRRDMNSAGVTAAKGGCIRKYFLLQTMIMPGQTNESFLQRIDGMKPGMSV